MHGVCVCLGFSRPALRFGDAIVQLFDHTKRRVSRRVSGGLHPSSGRLAGDGGKAEEEGLGMGVAFRIAVWG